MSETGAGDGARRRRRSLFEREQPAETRPATGPSVSTDATAIPPVKASGPTAALADVEIQPADAVPPVRRTPAPALQRPVSETLPLPLPANPTLMPISSVIETPPAVRERAPVPDEPVYVAPTPIEPPAIEPPAIEPPAIEPPAPPIEPLPVEAIVEAPAPEPPAADVAPEAEPPVQPVAQEPEAPYAEPAAVVEPAPPVAEAVDVDAPVPEAADEPTPGATPEPIAETAPESTPEPATTPVEELKFAPPIEAVPESKAEPDPKEAGVVAPLRRANRTSTGGDRPAPMQTLAPRVLDQPKRDEMLNSTADVNVALFFNNPDGPAEPEDEDPGPRPGVTMFASFGIGLLAVVFVGLLILVIAAFAVVLAT